MQRLPVSSMNCLSARKLIFCTQMLIAFRRCPFFSPDSRSLPLRNPSAGVKMPSPSTFTELLVPFGRQSLCERVYQSDDVSRGEGTGIINVARNVFQIYLVP